MLQFPIPRAVTKPVMSAPHDNLDLVSRGMRAWTVHPPRMVGPKLHSIRGGDFVLRHRQTVSLPPPM